MAQSLDNLKLDASNLYREDTISDLKAGSIRRMSPITPDGQPDPSRQPIFTAIAQVMTPGGVLPLSGEIAGATSLQEAIDRFPEAIQQAIRDLREEMEAIQRERASQIVVPGRDVPPGLGSMPPPSGGPASGGLIL